MDGCAPHNGYMQRGAIVLCGGKSTRMGQDKAALPFGPREVMLQRVVRILRGVVDPSRIVVVAAQGQEVPPLPPEVRVARDRRPGRGPLEGLASGLAALQGHADAAYVTSCDVPLLVPAFVERLFELISDFSLQTSDCDPLSKSAICNLQSEIQIVVPRDGQFHHPLAAVYRTNVLPSVEELLREDRLRPVFLFEKCRTLEVPAGALRAVDPELHSLFNCNRPEDFDTALALAFAASGPGRSLPISQSAEDGL
jgi:molybdopterin-guanine dinucleotide biosynthesis protein A